MKPSDLRQKSVQVLNKSLKEAQEKTRELRFKLASRQLKDVRALRKAKKDVALLLTVLNEKKSNQAPAQEDNN